MTKEVTHIRRGHLIYLASGALFRDCKTINAAKLESRLHQKEGVSDRWVVRVEAHKSPAAKIATRTRRPKAANQGHNWKTGGDR